MKKLIALGIFIAVALVLVIIPRESLSAGAYGQVLCQQPGYTCFKVPQGETWNTLFPNDAQRDLVMRINRVNINLRPGSVIAIPDNLDNLNILHHAPFEKQIGTLDKKTIIVDPTKLAWGAYDESGQLVNWGPAALGKSWCPDIQSSCRTKVGEFTVYRKGGEGCVSSKFPIPNGGAPMPFCMFFHGGYALHASADVPGQNASHGCVRMYFEDAKWLNHEFVEKGTRVIIKPYST